MIKTQRIELLKSKTKQLSDHQNPRLILGLVKNWELSVKLFMCLINSYRLVSHLPANMAYLG